MSDLDTGYDAGHEGGDVDYGHFQAGQEHEGLDQLHQAHGSEADYNNQFGVYEQDHASAESTEFSQGQHVEYDAPSTAHYEQDNFTHYNHDAAETDHVFAAEGSENSHQADSSELDALAQRFDASFASGTELHADGGSAGLGVASN
jgi:hypothetical protein